MEKQNIQTIASPIQQIPADIAYSFYSNSVMVMSSKDEMVLLFGQMPLQHDGTILATRIYMQKDMAEKLVQLINDSLHKEKKEEDTRAYG